MDDDLWGPPPHVVQDDVLHKQTLRGCEFWFDSRTDVLEEYFLNRRFSEQVWRIMNEKKQDAETDMDSSGSCDSHDIVSSDLDKILNAILLDADISSANLALEDTSSFNNAQTIQTRDSSNENEDADQQTRSKPPETAGNDQQTVKVSSHVVTCKIEEAEEQSCSSLGTDQVFGLIKQTFDNKSSSAISRENKANATNEDGEILKNHQQNYSLEATEPFTTESLLKMCDESNKCREISSDERSKRSHPEAVQFVDKDELSKSHINDNKVKNTSFIRQTKQKVQDGAGQIKIDPAKNSTETTPEIIGGSSVADSTMDSLNRINQRDVEFMPDSVKSISDLKNMTGKELRIIAKNMKITHYYKLKKEDLLQQLTRQLTRQRTGQITGCTKQRMES